MFRNLFRSGLAALALVAGLSLAGSARAQVPHKESSNGQITGVTATEMTWVAAGHGTHYGNYTEEGSHFYFSDGTLFGTFTITTANGDTMSGSYAGTFADLGGGFTSFDVDVEWLVGTGRLEGSTGVGSAYAVMENATGKVVISAGGLWNQP